MNIDFSVHRLLSTANERILVAAHRGSWVQAPENSLTAIHEAIELGADIVELDVRGTRDGVLVLLHDPTLDRTSSGCGPLITQNFKQVRGLQLKQRNGLNQPIVPQSCLPTLANALEAARGHIIVNIDTKDPSLTEHIAQFVIAAGMADQVFVKATIQTPQDVEQVRDNPFFGKVAFVPMMLARPGQFSSDLRWLEPLQCPMYEVAFTDIADLEEGRDELKRQGARLWVNTIECSHSLDFNDARATNDPDGVWGRLLEAGVGAIQTDDVPAVIHYLNQKGAR